MPLERTVSIFSIIIATVSRFPEKLRVMKGFWARVISVKTAYPVGEFPSGRGQTRIERIISPAMP